jgi:HEPN domain-containing protein
MNEVTSEWVAKAEEDFHSADALLRAVDVPLAGTSCFHSQQCAEKYLKAFLQEHAVRFERKHDLLPLVALCIQMALVHKSKSRRNTFVGMKSYTTYPKGDAM